MNYEPLSEDPEWEHVGYLVDDQGNATDIPVYAKPYPATGGGSDKSYHNFIGNAAIDISTTENFNLTGWTPGTSPYDILSPGCVMNIRVMLNEKNRAILEQMARGEYSLPEIAGEEDDTNTP